MRCGHLFFIFILETLRAHLHARNNILSILPGFLFLLPENQP